jgi:hypothetical protein
MPGQTAQRSSVHETGGTPDELRPAHTFERHPPLDKRASSPNRNSHPLRTRSIRAAKPLLARLLHRQSMGALTGRAAFPSMASALAIAWQEHSRQPHDECRFVRELRELLRRRARYRKCLIATPSRPPACAAALSWTESGCSGCVRRARMRPRPRRLRTAPPRRRPDRPPRRSRRSRSRPRPSGIPHR